MELAIIIAVKRTFLRQGFGQERVNRYLTFLKQEAIASKFQMLQV
jgi:hypothetical protein